MPFDTSMYQNFRGGTGLAALADGLKTGIDLARQREQAALQEQAAKRQQEAFEADQAAQTLDMRGKMLKQLGETASGLYVKTPEAQEAEYKAFRDNQIAQGAKPQWLPESFAAARPMIDFYHGQHQRSLQDAAAKQARENRELDLKQMDIQQRALDRGETRAARLQTAALARDEKLQALQTPFGLANTPDDAKQLKEAFEAKRNFDSKIQDMIDLRKKYGTEYTNREAVARGKQLSKDLLLEYKNMAKLGVLSKSDEDIINAIIPSDPLANDWAPFQDPILSNMEKFKADSDKDFQTRIGTRTRAGIGSVANKTQKPSATKYDGMSDGELAALYEQRIRRSAYAKSR